MPILDRFRSAWNAFQSHEESGLKVDYSHGGGTPYYSGVPPSRPRLPIYNERSIIGSIYTRMAIDVAAVDFRHVLVDDEERYSDEIGSGLNSCLKFETNIDQAPREFRMDIVLSMFAHGVAAIVPVDTTRDPNTNEIFDIQTMRVGQVVDWYPSQVRVNVYNEMKGIREDIVVDKRYVAIVQNPLHTVMNEPSSTLQRLIRKLSLLDSIDEQTGSGKLDIIIQLPYAIKSDSKRQQAEQRRTDIEWQLKGSQYGIAYADATEKITQLNRPAENNLLKQIEYLTGLLYDQLGLTKAVMDGTADEAAMLNYHNRTVEPIVDAIKEAMQRSFVGPAGIKKNHRIMYFADPFKLVPIAQIAEIVDKFARNEVLSSNEVRQIIGRKPSNDPKADQLVNSNMPQPAEEVMPAEEDDGEMDAALSEIESTIDELTKELGGELPDA